MAVKLHCLVLFVVGSVIGVGGGTVAAQDAGRHVHEGQGLSKVVEEDRAAFDALNQFRELYELNRDQRVINFVRTFTDHQTEHHAHQKKTEVTRRRLRVAISIVAADEKRSAEDKARLIKTFQEQAIALNAGGPLSYTNVFRFGEALLTQEEIAAGRERLKERFRDRIASGIPFDMNRLDYLMMNRLEPGPLPELPIGGSKAAPNQPQTRELPRQPEPRPPVRTTPTPTPTPAEPPPPAPPVDEWASRIESTVAQLGYTGDQKTKAHDLLEQYRTKATAHRTASQAEYDAAEKLSGQEKAARLSELNAPLDRMFHELTQRVESLATVEQRLKAEKPADGDS